MPLSTTRSSWLTALESEMTFTSWLLAVVQKPGVSQATSVSACGKEWGGPGGLQAPHMQSDLSALLDCDARHMSGQPCVSRLLLQARWACCNEGKAQAHNTSRG